MITLTKTPEGNLRIGLTDEGRAQVADVQQMKDRHGIDFVLGFFLAHSGFESDWDWLQPEDIGALTSSPILSDDFDRDDYGNVTRVGRVYWNPRYQVEDDIQTLVENGTIEWEGVA